MCEINIGRTPSRSDNSLWDKEKKSHNVWVSIADMPDCPTDTIYETKEYISDKAARNINIIKKGTILLSFKLTLGKTAIAGIDLYTNEAIANLPIKDKEISREYLLYYFRFFDWNSYSSGEEKVKGKTLNKKKLDVLPIYYPSLSEQQTIVSRLDSAFAKIDAVKDNAEKQLNDAKALFQKELSKAMMPKEGWERKKLGEVCASMADGPFGSNLKKEHYTESKEVRIIQLSNIGEDGWREDNTKYTTFEHLETIKRSEVKPGDIVIAKMMPAGRAILCPNHESGYVLSSDAVRATLKKDLDNNFILFSINSEYFRKQVYANVSGSGRVRTSLTKLKECFLYIPTLSEQQAIVSHLDTLSEKLETVEERQKTIMAECDAMKQALLREVFE